MGEAIAARLLRENASIVLVGDQSIENESATIEKLNRLPKNDASDILRVDSRIYGFDVVQNKSRLPQVFADCDIVVNALPAHLSPIIVEAVLKTNELKFGAKKHKTHYCDLGGVLEITKKILSKKNHMRAERCGVSIVPECGFQPGNGNVHAVELYEKYFGTGITWLKTIIDSMIIYVGGLPKISPFYKELFNLKGLEEIYYNSPLVLSNGKSRKIKRLSHYETMHSTKFGFYFGDPMGFSMEAAVTGGLGVLPYHMKGMAKKLQEKTLRHIGHYNFIKNTPREKFTETIRGIVSECPAAAKDFCLMHIEAVGICKNTEKKIIAERTFYIESDDDFNSMQKATGFTTAVIAKMIAAGRAKPGAHPPETALDPEATAKVLAEEIPIIQEFVTLLK